MFSECWTMTWVGVLEGTEQTAGIVEGEVATTFRVVMKGETGVGELKSLCQRSKPQCL